MQAVRCLGWRFIRGWRCLAAELFFYFYLPEICLLSLVAWWIYRRNRAQKPPDLLPAQRKNRYALSKLGDAMQALTPEAN